MSDTNRVSLAYRAETTFGEFITANPDFQALRFTGETLHQEQETTASQEIRSDRQISDIVRTSLRAAGDLNGELSYGAYDEFFKAAFLADADFPVLKTVIAASVLVSVSDAGVLTLSSGSWTNNPVAGGWIEIRGFTGTPANNGYVRVASFTTGTITTAGKVFVADAEGEAVTITEGGHIRNGVTFYSYNIEKKYNDLTNNFSQLAGMAIDGLSINVPTSGIITLTFRFIGKKEQSATATLGDGANTAAATNNVMAGVDDVEAIVEGVIADAGAFGATQFTFELNNNLRARLQIGTLGAVSIGTGTCEPRGTLQAYYSDANTSVEAKFLADTESSLAIVFEDDVGNAYILDIVAIRYSQGPRNATAINQDVILDLAWAAKMHPTLGYTIQLTRFAA